MYSRYPTCIAPCRVDSKSPIDVSPGLIKLDSLPCVLGRLADRGTIVDAHNALVVYLLLLLGGLLLLLLVVIGNLLLLLVNVTLDLTLAESEGQVELK